jgi:secreted trypsin-like serine protease
VPLVSQGLIRFGCNDGTEFVAGEPQYSADACGGHTGGPALVTHEGVHYLAGLTSRSLPNATRDADSGVVCNAGGVYCRMDRHQEFIESILRGSTDNPTKIDATRSSAE